VDDLLIYAAQVDRELVGLLGYPRSGQSRVQRDVADKMIQDHHAACSAPVEAARLIAAPLKTLEVA
jgi:hypothetical protein